MMNFKKNIYAISIVAASAVVLGVAGCGITPQDEGLGAASSKAVSGIVVDGYLAGATVFIDVNENNRLDAWEERALTDTSGYYSYNPVTGINYCELAPTDAKYIHCLKSPAGYDEVMIRMRGGYDLATVEPFVGTISMKMNVSSVVLDTPVAATPITGLMSEMTAEEQATFLALEGISAEGAVSDFMDFANSITETERRNLLGLALKAHKIADVVASLIDVEFDQGTVSGGSPEGGFFGVASGVPVDGSVYVYRAMVQQMLSSNTALSTILSDLTRLTAVVERTKVEIAEGAIQQYNDKLAIDEDTGLIAATETALLAPSTIDAAGHAALAIKIAQTVDAVFANSLDVTDKDTLQADILSRMRATDVVVSLTRDGEAANIVDNAVSLASDPTYLANLALPSADLASLKKKFAAQPGLVVASDADFSGRQPFSALLVSDAGSAFTATDGSEVNTAGFAGNTLALNNTPSDQSAGSDEVSVSFQGDTPDATGGDLTIDATLLGGDFAKKDANGNPEPLSLTGTWEKVDDYTMIMNIEVTAGVFEPVIVKPNETGGYYFDLGGEQVVWGGGAATP